MATIKSEYYRFNGVSWDIHYFKTTMDMVEGLQTALDGKVELTGNQNISGTKNFTDTLLARTIRVDPNGAPSSNLGSPSIAEMALFQEQFNNKTEFYNIAKIKFYTSTDNVNWTEITTFTDASKRIFVGGDGTTTGITIPNNTPYFRIEIENDGNYVYLNALYMYWQSSGHSSKVRIWQKPRNTQVWGIVTNSNSSVSSWPGHLYLPFPTIPFHPTGTTHADAIRIEFENTWNLNSTTNPSGWNLPIYLHKMQIWGGYPAGKRTIYSVNEYKDVNFPSLLREMGQRVYSPNNKPSIADLGALVETNQKLLFGGSTQYIRLAYAGNTQAFIKHGADATEEELWHSGNFNPSDYMPKSGGTFTGAVAFTGLTSFDTLDINTMYVDTISSDGGSISFGGVDNINFGYIDLVGIRGLYSETDSFQLSDENIPTLRCGPTGAGTFEVYGSIWTDGDITSKSRKVITEGPTAAKTANYTFVLGDANGFIYSNSASALTFTIPLNSSVAYPTGTEIHIMRYGTGEISISPTSGVTLVSEGSKRRINAQYQAASLKKLDTNTWVLIGALKS